MQQLILHEFYIRCTVYVYIHMTVCSTIRVHNDNMCEECSCSKPDIHTFQESVKIL